MCRDNATIFAKVKFTCTRVMAGKSEFGLSFLLPTVFFLVGLLVPLKDAGVYG